MLDFCLIFFENETMIPLTTILAGIIGNIHNLFNKSSKYFVLGIIVYSFMLVYGLFYLCSMSFTPTLM